MSNRTRKWIRSGVEMLIHGFWAAVVSCGAAYWIDKKDWALWSANFFQMFFGVFFLQGGMRAAQFYMNNPLPPEGDTDPPFPDVKQPQISLNPLGKVMPVNQTVTTTETKP